MNTTYFGILGIVSAAVVAGILELLPPHLEYLPVAMALALVILQLLGKFKPESGITDKQRDFMQRAQDEADADESLGAEDVVINMLDENGNESKIIIKSNGEVETEGEPDAKMVEAAKGLKASVIEFGAEAVATELARQMEERNKK